MSDRHIHTEGPDNEPWNWHDCPGCVAREAERDKYRKRGDYLADAARAILHGRPGNLRANELDALTEALAEWEVALASESGRKK